ncbi:hypothetical protein PoB_006755700 [Plakobranchus ocellatus]|uniref:Uncharacterized protein n=1 Tax=Plakobranchus ocellatus TaxID=259542 RepID=A0AAV4DA27_9GAST|nr:hypothetical protein PoB_006755700 [Plakobranchus ocellatus]
MKLLLDLTTTTWLEHCKNHAAADKDYDTHQFDSDEVISMMRMTIKMKAMMIMMVMTTIIIMLMLLLLLQLMMKLDNLDDYAESIIMNYDGNDCEHDSVGDDRAYYFILDT